MFDIELVTSKGSVDCGPASLKMLLAYYGTEVSLDDLAQECSLRIGGCTGKDILRVGQAHGLDMKAFRMDADELILQDRPGIIWWCYSHFVVFCGKDDKGNVVIANPNRGRFGIDKASFAALYTGVSFWNGEPETMPEEETATAADYENALGRLGVEV